MQYHIVMKLVIYTPPTWSPLVEAPAGSSRARRRCSAPLAVPSPSEAEKSPPAASSSPAEAGKPAVVTREIPLQCHVILV